MENDRPELETQEEMPQMELVAQLGSSLLDTPQGTVYLLSVVGQIEGHQALPAGSKATRYEHVLPMLAQVEANPGFDGLLILLNTAGGDVEAGLAMAELVASMKKPTVSLVLGGQPFHRSAAGGGGGLFVHCAFGCHDHPSGAA